MNGSEEDLLQPEFTKAATSHRTVFTSMMKNLREAKFEHYVKGTEKEYFLEKKLVECMQVGFNPKPLHISTVLISARSASPNILEAYEVQPRRNLPFSHGPKNSLPTPRPQ